MSPAIASAILEVNGNYDNLSDLAVKCMREVGRSYPNCGYGVYGRNLWGSPTDSNADFAWLQHRVKPMDKNNGRLAVVLTQGVLFRSGKEGAISAR